MRYNTLGNSSLSVSEIASGCMSIHQPTADNIRLLNQAFESGINFFDTADLYDHGANESMLGKALRSHRKKLAIATKVGNEWNEDGKSWKWNPSREHILRSVDESLRRLQTDYIDLYQLHGGTIDDAIDETIGAFEQLQQSGKIRYYGISSIRPNVIHAWLKKSKAVSVMMQYSLLDRRPESLFPLLDKNNVSVLARGSVAQGLLIDKPAKPYIDRSALEVENMLSRFHQLTPQSLAIAAGFVLSARPVKSIVAGIRSQKQLDDWVKALDVAFNPETLHGVASIFTANNYKDHL